MKRDKTNRSLTTKPSRRLSLTSRVSLIKNLRPNYMPWHLELGSSGHNFPHGKAIVVNTLTGRHASKDPIPLPKAKAQLRVLEAAHKKERKK